MNLLQQVAFSTVLIEAGVPEEGADSITDCVTEDRTLDDADAWAETYEANLSSLACWTADPRRLWDEAVTAADRPDCAGIDTLSETP